MQWDVMELTFADHSDRETLLKAAELAAIPVAFVNHTVVVCQTHVLGTFLHRPLSTPSVTDSSTSGHDKAMCIRYMMMAKLETIKKLKLSKNYRNILANTENRKKQILQNRITVLGLSKNSNKQKQKRSRNSAMSHHQHLFLVNLIKVHQAVFHAGKR